jgi:hypothetical protein
MPRRDIPQFQLPGPIHARQRPPVRTERNGTDVVRMPFKRALRLPRLQIPNLNCLVSPSAHQRLAVGCEAIGDAVCVTP